MEFFERRSTQVPTFSEREIIRENVKDAKSCLVRILLVMISGVPLYLYAAYALSFPEEQGWWWTLHRVGGIAAVLVLFAGGSMVIWWTLRLIFLFAESGTYRVLSFTGKGIRLNRAGKKGNKVLLSLSWSEIAKAKIVHLETFGEFSDEEWDWTVTSTLVLIGRGPSDPILGEIDHISRFGNEDKLRKAIDNYLNSPVRVEIRKELGEFAAKKRLERVRKAGRHAARGRMEEEIGVPFSDSARAAVFEQKYVFEHPCTCGGKWEMRSHDSPFPSGTSEMVCICSKCGIEKVFIFRLL